MSNHKDIESFLRENRPQVDENPLFILEVQQKMEVVKGIKAEVDRQRNYGRMAIVIALALGVAAGGFFMCVAYLYPFDPQRLEDNIFTVVKMYVEPWKPYLFILTSVCTILLGLIFSRTNKGSVRL